MSQMDAINKKATIYDVAARAGVSKSLVSLVLRGDSAVSPAKRTAVQEAIKDLNYRPSRNAQNLAASRTKTIGMVITEYENLAYSNVLIGLREVFDKLDYQVLLTDLHTNPNLHGDALDALVSMDVEAIVLFVEPANLNTSGLNVPTILVGLRETQVKGADLIYSDDYLGSKLVLDHLIKLGHKNIAHLSGLGGIAGNRRKAYVEIMQEQGLPRISFGENQKTNQLGGYLATKELIASGKPFTAIYAANDYIAAGAIAALAEIGKTVPGDVSIVGYDNAPIAREYAMKLTTVDDMGLELGKQAAEQLIKHLEGNKSQKPKQIVIEPTLVVRKSTSRKK